MSSIQLTEHGLTQKSNGELADARWLNNLQKAIATGANFIIAEIRGDADLHKRAGEVLCQVGDEFKAVRDIEKSCGNHGWNNMIYEAWLWERRNLIFTIYYKLSHCYERDALLLYAVYVDSFEISFSDVQIALNQASMDMDGLLEENLFSDTNEDSIEEIF